MRLEERLYIGRPCPNCGTFVGISLPTETRKVEFIPESQRESFEHKSGMKLDEVNKIEVNGESGYAVMKLNSGMQDYVDMLAEQGTTIKDGVVTDLGTDIKKHMIETVESGSGWWM